LPFNLPNFWDRFAGLQPLGKKVFPPVLLENFFNPLITATYEMTFRHRDPKAWPVAEFFRHLPTFGGN